MATAQFLDEKLEEIAKKHFHIETLDPRNSDRLDFKEVSVWDIKRALEEAYNEGRKSWMAVTSPHLLE